MRSKRRVLAHVRYSKTSKSNCRTTYSVLSQNMHANPCERISANVYYSNYTATFRSKIQTVNGVDGDVSSCLSSFYFIFCRTRAIQPPYKCREKFYFTARQGFACMLRWNETSGFAVALASFYARQQELLWRVLAISILSVCPSVHHMGGSGKNGAS